MTNAEFNELFRQRTRKFAVRILQFLDTLPNGNKTRIISYQLGKSATSVGANFRAFCRGRSQKEKYAKICIVVEEADESEYWLLMLDDLNLGAVNERKLLLKESLEIVKVCAKIKSGLGG